MNASKAVARMLTLPLALVISHHMPYASTTVERSRHANVSRMETIEEKAHTASVSESLLKLVWLSSLLMAYHSF
jgi:hypothetical protein